MSTLYVTATPIGNLEDFSPRGKRVLDEVDLILCEDTRVTRKLLSHFDIHTKVDSYHGHSSDKKIDKTAQLLEAGKDVALVSDAGTPTISDPGSRLISGVRERVPEVNIVSVPGPAAVTAALSISGLPASDFLFLGFLPRKKGRSSKLEKVAESNYTVALYESPHRIEKLLGELDEVLASDRKVVVAREITKVYEEVVSGTPKEVVGYFKNNSDKVRGEFVVMISGK